jgi:hypothetical protein
LFLWYSWKDFFLIVSFFSLVTIRFFHWLIAERQKLWKKQESICGFSCVMTVLKNIADSAGEARLGTVDLALISPEIIVSVPPQGSNSV